MLYLHITAITYTKQARIKQEKEWTWRNIVILKLRKKRGKENKKVWDEKLSLWNKDVWKACSFILKEIIGKRKRDYLKEKKRLFERIR